MTNQHTYTGARDGLQHRLDIVGDRCICGGECAVSGEGDGS